MISKLAELQDINVSATVTFYTFHIFENEPD